MTFLVKEVRVFWKDFCIMHGFVMPRGTKQLFKKPKKTRGKMSFSERGGVKSK